MKKEHSFISGFIVLLIFCSCFFTFFNNVNKVSAAIEMTPEEKSRRQSVLASYNEAYSRKKAQEQKDNYDNAYNNGYEKGYNDALNATTLPEDTATTYNDNNYRFTHAGYIFGTYAKGYEDAYRENYTGSFSASDARRFGQPSEDNEISYAFHAYLGSESYSSEDFTYFKNGYENGITFCSISEDLPNSYYEGYRAGEKAALSHSNTEQLSTTEPVSLNESDKSIHSKTSSLPWYFPIIICLLLIPVFWIIISRYAQQNNEDLLSSSLSELYCRHLKTFNYDPNNSSIKFHLIIKFIVFLICALITHFTDSLTISSIIMTIVLSLHFFTHITRRREFKEETLSDHSKEEVLTPIYRSYIVVCIYQIIVYFSSFLIYLFNT